MAREAGGGGGGLGWTILGVLVGIAATLAVQTLLSSQHAPPVQNQTAASSSAVVAAVAPRPAPIIPKPSSAAPADSSDNPARQLSHEDVQDDADAVGMTSRSTPSQASSQPSGAVN